MAARRAIVRWVWRLFRREWRQQVLVVALLSLSVAVAVTAVSTAYGFAPPGEAKFGDASHRIEVEVTEPGRVDPYLTAAEGWFGGIDVIGHRRVPVPGSAERVEIRAQDPRGRYGAPLLDVREGRYPAGRDELAVTDGVAETLGLAAGDRLDLDGTVWSVVGVVENPTDLDDEFALVAPAAPASPPFSGLSVLVRGTEEDVASFPAEADPGPGYVESRGGAHKDAAAIGALAGSTVVLLLVCLVATAAFVVVAQRRLRQLGMLAATGATERQLRSVVVAHGVAAGVVAALVGTVVGLVVWAAVAPRVEAAAGHRIDRFDVPLGQVGLAMVLAVLAAGLAAWWPARAVARIPVIRALSGRPPEPRTARRSLVLAGLLVAVGVGSLVVEIDATVPDAEVNGPVVILGVLAIPLGIALACPVVVRALAPLATPLPVAARLALRDLARYQARSGAALAAISLGLGIAVAVIVAAAAATYHEDEGNLSDRQLLFRVDEANEVGSLVDLPDLPPGEVEDLASTVDAVAATLDDPVVVPLDMARDPAVQEPRAGEVLRPPVGLAREVSETTLRDMGPLFVATPEVLGFLGLDPATLDPGTEVVTSLSEATHFVPTSDRSGAIQGIEVVDGPGYSAVPRSLLTTEAVRRHGWEVGRAGWLVESGAPLTGDQVAAAREAAAGVGLTVEARRGQEGLAQLRSAATGVALLVGLGILAMTVGLIRSEAAGDLRTLAAAGASARARRAVTGLTAGALALAGALLGTAGAYLGLGAGYADDLGALGQVPVLNLVTVCLGLPLLAAVAGWLLAGREPASLARTPLD